MPSRADYERIERAAKPEEEVEHVPIFPPGGKVDRFSADG